LPRSEADLEQSSSCWPPESGIPGRRLLVESGRYLLDETGGANFDAINAFLNEHPNWPRLTPEHARREEYA
jgi:hypothetical protein